MGELLTPEQLSLIRNRLQSRSVAEDPHWFRNAILDLLDHIDALEDRINPEMLDRETPGEMRRTIARYREALERIGTFRPSYDDFELCHYCYRIPEPHAEWCPTRIANETLEELLSFEQLEKIRKQADMKTPPSWEDRVLLREAFGHIKALEDILREVPRMMDDVYEGRRSFPNEQRILYRIFKGLQTPEG